MGLAQAIKALAGGDNPAALGKRVRRPGVATDLAAAAPTTVNLFQISAGDILLTGIYGKVTTIIGAVGATTIHLDIVPTGGVSQVLCTATAINTDAVNSIYTIDGNPATALAVGAGLGMGRYQFVNPVILVPGIIGLIVSVSVNTGVIDWVLHYVPLDTDSRVAPV